MPDLGTAVDMEPVPATRETFDKFGPFGVEEDLEEHLQRSADLVRAVVPSCVGLSLAAFQHGVTFTLTATSEEISVLDAVQYLEGGPCVTGAHQGEVIAFEVADSPLDEKRWAVFARATAACGIASTLTLPITDRGQVSGSINLYSSQPHAFDGHHDQVAAIFGAWAGGAVADADLGFETRRRAEEAPRELQEQITISQAVGMILADRGVDATTATHVLEDAATRAGVQIVEMARAVLDNLHL